MCMVCSIIIIIYTLPILTAAQDLAVQNVCEEPRATSKNMCKTSYTKRSIFPSFHLQPTVECAQYCKVSRVIINILKLVPFWIGLRDANSVIMDQFFTRLIVMHNARLR